MEHQKRVIDMPKELADLKRILPKGHKRDIDTKGRVATITAPAGHVWVHSQMNVLHYCQPTVSRHEFFEDICADVSLGIIKKKKVKK